MREVQVAKAVFDPFFRPDDEDFLNRYGQGADSKAGSMTVVGYAPNEDPEPILYYRDEGTWHTVMPKRRRVGLV